MGKRKGGVWKIACGQINILTETNFSFRKDPKDLSVPFTWKIFLVLACVLLIKKTKCAKHNELQIFQKQFSMIF